MADSLSLTALVLFNDLGEECVVRPGVTGHALYGGSTTVNTAPWRSPV